MSGGGIEDVFGSFPGRPDHPDFWKLSSVILGMDGAMDEGEDITKMIGEVVDPNSLLYMAHQRALRMCQLIGMPLQLAGRLVPLYLDAFLAGVRYDAAQFGGEEKGCGLFDAGIPHGKHPWKAHGSNYSCKGV